MLLYVHQNLYCLKPIPPTMNGIFSNDFPIILAALVIVSRKINAAKIIGIKRQTLNTRTLLNPMNPRFVRTEKDGISETKVILRAELERILKNGN